MMFWFGDGMTGWGYPAMAMGMVLAWWLVGLGVWSWPTEQLPDPLGTDSSWLNPDHP